MNKLTQGVVEGETQPPWANHVMSSHVIPHLVASGDLFDVRGQRLKSVWAENHPLDLLAPHQSFPYPTRVAAAIKDSKNHSLVVNNSIIYGEWESLGELAVVSKNALVNAAEVC